MSESTKAKGRDDQTKKGTLKGKPGQKAFQPTALPEGKNKEVTAVVYRAAGVEVVKRSRVTYPAAIVSDVVYIVQFEGREPASFTRMGEAVENAKAGPPALPQAPDADTDATVEQEIVKSLSEAA